jgi:hypothetical protein
MHPYTAVIAQRQLEELWAQSAEQRLARAASSANKRPGRFSRALGSVRTAFTTPVDGRSQSFLPTLSDYPTRG